MKNITIQPIEGSSQISGIGHDPATNTLAVQFHKREKGKPLAPGSVYHYADVPQTVAAEFLAAESKGKFFGEAIKGKFAHEKQEPTETK